MKPKLRMRHGNSIAQQFRVDVKQHVAQVMLFWHASVELKSWFLDLPPPTGYNSRLNWATNHLYKCIMENRSKQQQQKQQQQQQQQQEEQQQEKANTKQTHI